MFRFELEKFADTGLVVPRPAHSKVAMLSSRVANSSSGTSGGTNFLVLRQLNLETFREDRETAINGRFASVRDFVEVGAGKFAFVEFSSTSFGSSASFTSSVYLFS